MVLEAIAVAEVPVWIAGGWGVDALAGRVTREHRDLDLAVRAEDLDRAVDAVAGLGFVVETDWLPTRVELGGGPGGWVDLHPVRFDADGNGVLAGLDGETYEYPAEDFTQGVIGGRLVQCISPRLQRRLHQGYAPRTRDLHDLRVLEGLDSQR